MGKPAICENMAEGRFAPGMFLGICREVGGGFTKVFNAVATSETLRTAMRVLSGSGILSIVGIGDQVKLDLTPLWIKLQTIKGVYRYGFHEIDGKRRHTYDLALDLVRERARMVMIISPEGTRKRVKVWKTGFYHIARGADVPVLLAFSTT